MSIHRHKKRHDPVGSWICINTENFGINKKKTNYCVYVIQPPGQLKRKTSRDVFIPTAGLVAGTSIRRRILETRPSIRTVEYVLKDTYKPQDRHPTYSSNYVVQGQKILEEWASPLVKGDKKEWMPFQHYKRWLGKHIPYPYSYGHRFYAPDQDDFGGCQHVGTHTDEFWLYTLDGLNYGIYDPERGLPLFVVEPDQDGDFIPYPPDVSDLTENALNSMLPRIRAELSLVNSLIELTDFKHLPEQLYQISTAIGRFLTGSTSRIRAIYRRFGTLANMANAGGSSFLQWKFFLAPFISDVVAIMQSLEASHNRIIRLLKASAKVQHRHYTRAFKEFDDVPDLKRLAAVFHGPDIVSLRTSRRVIYEPTKFHAEIEYHYGYSDFQVEFAQLLGLLDQFGVNVNPATIWRAIPFSFVIDWVVNVGRWLDRLKLRNMDPTLNIHKYLWSVSRRREISCTIERSSANYPPNIGNYYPNGDTALPLVTETSFGRWITLPDRTTLTSGRLDSQEFTLGTALLLSRGRYRRRKRTRLRSATKSNRKH